MIRIASNDYLTNIPGATGVNSGGTAIFARWLRDDLIRQGYSWCGIVIVRSHGRRVVAKRLKSGRRTYWQVSIPIELLHAVATTRRPLDPVAWFAEPIAAIADILRQDRPDVVMINGAYTLPWLLAHAAHAAGIPIVVQHAGIWRQEVLASKSFTKRGRDIALNMERSLSELATKEVFLNDFSWRIYNKLVRRVPLNRGVVIPLPFEFPDPVPPIKPVAQAKSMRLSIGIVARWDRVKNHEGYYQVARAARQQNLTWHFSAVTSIPETPRRRRFKQQYRALISIVPPMSRAKLRRWYRQLDVLLVPSVFETASYVALEAIAHGVPVLVSPTVGFGDSLKKYGAGSHVVSYDDPHQVIKRIIRILSRPAAPSLQSKLKSLHHPMTVSRQYRQLLREIAATKK